MSVPNRLNIPASFGPRGILTANTVVQSVRDTKPEATIQYSEQSLIIGNIAETSLDELGQIIDANNTQKYKDYKPTIEKQDEQGNFIVKLILKKPENSVPLSSYEAELATRLMEESIQRDQKALFDSLPTPDPVEIEKQKIDDSIACIEELQRLYQSTSNVLSAVLNQTNDMYNQAGVKVDSLIHTRTMHKIIIPLGDKKDTRSKDS